MRRRFAAYRTWHNTQPARPAAESLTTFRMVGWALLFGLLLYVTLIRSNPEGVQYGTTPEWCPSATVQCEDWGQGVLR